MLPLPQVPFFYYLLLISASAWGWLAFGQARNLGFSAPPAWPSAYHPSLWRIYAVWVGLGLVLYWPCRWYQKNRQRHSYWWLSFL